MQDRGAPAERDVDKLAHRGFAGDAFGPALPAPGVRELGGGAAFQDCVIGIDRSPGDGQVEGVEEAERVEIGAREARLGHVEVFRMECVRTSIIGRPRRLSVERHDPAFSTWGLHPQLRRAHYTRVEGRALGLERASV